VAYYWEFVDNLKKKHCWLWGSGASPT
jgi:hypothetical protein